MRPHSNQAPANNKTSSDGANTVRLPLDMEMSELYFMLYTSHRRRQGTGQVECPAREKGIKENRNNSADREVEKSIGAFLLKGPS